MEGTIYLRAKGQPTVEKIKEALEIAKDNSVTVTLCWKVKVDYQETPIKVMRSLKPDETLENAIEKINLMNERVVSGVSY